MTEATPATTPPAPILPTYGVVKIEKGSNDVKGKGSASPCCPVVCGNRGKGKSHVKACEKMQGNTITFEDETLHSPESYLRN